MHTIETLAPEKPAKTEDELVDTFKRWILISESKIGFIEPDVSSTRAALASGDVPDVNFEVEVAIEEFKLYDASYFRGLVSKIYGEGVTPFWAEMVAERTKSLVHAARSHICGDRANKGMPYVNEFFIRNALSAVGTETRPVSRAEITYRDSIGMETALTLDFFVLNPAERRKLVSEYEVLDDKLLHVDPIRNKDAFFAVGKDDQGNNFTFRYFENTFSDATACLTAFASAASAYDKARASLNWSRADVTYTVLPAEASSKSAGFCTESKVNLFSNYLDEVTEVHECVHALLFADYGRCHNRVLVEGMAVFNSTLRPEAAYAREQNIRNRKFLETLSKVAPEDLTWDVEKLRELFPQVPDIEYIFGNYVVNKLYASGGVPALHNIYRMLSTKNMEMYNTATGEHLIKNGQCIADIDAVTDFVFSLEGIKIQDFYKELVADAIEDLKKVKILGFI